MGADVAITYASRPEGGEANAAELREKYGVRAKAYHLNVGDYDQVDKVVHEIIKDFGKIDCFIANAGRTAHGGVLEESVQDWNEVMATDLTGVYCCARSRSRISATLRLERMMCIFA